MIMTRSDSYGRLMNERQKVKLDNEREKEVGGGKGKYKMRSGKGGMITKIPRHNLAKQGGKLAIFITDSCSNVAAAELVAQQLAVGKGNSKHTCSERNISRLFFPFLENRRQSTTTRGCHSIDDDELYHHDGDDVSVC